MEIIKGIAGVTKMQDCNDDVIVHLFEIMSKYGAKCSLEFQSDGTTDPLFGISNYPVELIDYFVREGGPDSILIELGDIGFNFELGANKFSKDVSDTQIFICISSDHYCAWFNSGFIPPEGIEEAKNYKYHDPEFDDKEIHLNATEEQEFEDGVDWLRNMLLEGRVIKKAVVVAEGEQIITIGFHGENNVVPIG